MGDLAPPAPPNIAVPDSVMSKLIYRCFNICLDTCIAGGNGGGLGAEALPNFFAVPTCAFAGRACNRVVNSELRNVNVLY